jgi:hypothetical protein
MWIRERLTPFVNRKKRPKISVIREGHLLVKSALSSFTADGFRRTMQAWATPHHALRV